MYVGCQCVTLKSLDDEDNDNHNCIINNNYYADNPNPMHALGLSFILRISMTKGSIALRRGKGQNSLSIA